MKVKGQLRTDGKKDYSITYEGKEYKAVRQESGCLFSCNGFEGSLKSIKSRIVLGLIQETEEPSTKDMAGKGTWDHVKPETLLAMILPFVRDSCFIPEALLDQVNNTLDCYGLLKGDGNPDSEFAWKDYSIQTGKLEE